MIGIDLFAGAGGMSLGASAAGVNVKIAVEMDKYAAETYKANHSTSNLIIDDIRNIQHFDILDRNQELVLFGGPPCQGFSTSNQRTRSSQNENNWLFQEFVRVARTLKPDWIIFENVKGILETEKGKFLEEISNSLSDLGYTITYDVLIASDFGIPQSRSRFFLIGSLYGVNVKLPKPKFGKNVTVSEAIQDLPILKNGAVIDWLEYGSKPNSTYAKKMRGNLIGTGNHLVTKNAAHM